MALGDFFPPFSFGTPAAVMNEVQKLRMRKIEMREKKRKTKRESFQTQSLIDRTDQQQKIEGSAPPSLHVYVYSSRGRGKFFGVHTPINAHAVVIKERNIGYLTENQFMPSQIVFESESFGMEEIQKRFPIVLLVDIEGNILKNIR